MNSPTQNEKDRLSKIENDVQLMLMLQEATRTQSRNNKLVLSHNNDLELEIYQEKCDESGYQTEINTDVACQRGMQSGMPPSGLLIKMAYKPNQKNNSRSVICCSKHSRSTCSNMLTSPANTLVKHKVIRGCNLGFSDAENRRLQEIKCLKSRLKGKEEELKNERAAKNKAVDNAESLKEKHEKLHKELCKLKNEMVGLKKAKTNISELQNELLSLKEERNDLKALADTQKCKLSKLENKLCKLKMEQNKISQEGQCKVQELLKENSELAGKVVELYHILHEVKKEVQLKEKNHQDGCLGWCFKSEEEQERSYCSLKEKLRESEEVQKDLESEICQLKTELDARKCELLGMLEQKEKRICELTQANASLDETLRMHSVHEQTKECELRALRERNECLSKQLEELRETTKVNEKSFIVQEGPNLQNQGGGFEDESKSICDVLAALERTREALEQEKMESEKKTRLINEQEEMIQKMKDDECCKLEKMENLLRERERAERSMQLSFSQERRQNEKLLDEVTELKWQERELSRQLEDIYEHLEQQEQSMNNGGGCEEHSHLLEQIEEEVAEKTAEWQECIDKLTQERDEAIEAARFSSQKLNTSLEEFQRHVTMQRKVQQSLIGLLHQRENELRIAAHKISMLKADTFDNFQDNSAERNDCPQQYESW